MAVLAQSADLAHPKRRFLFGGGEDLHAALGQPIGHGLAVALKGNGLKLLCLPGRLLALAVGDDVNPLVVPTLKGCGAPGLDEGDADGSGDDAELVLRARPQPRAITCRQPALALREQDGTWGCCGLPIAIDSRIGRVCTRVKAEPSSLTSGSKVTSPGGAEPAPGIGPGRLSRRRAAGGSGLPVAPDSAYRRLEHDLGTDLLRLGVPGEAFRLRPLDSGGGRRPDRLVGDASSVAHPAPMGRLGLGRLHRLRTISSTGFRLACRCR
jgi:hypothetical protein